VSVRRTVAQALVRFLGVQEIERDGERSRFFGGCFGIFGHGNVAGLGQALQQHEELLPYRQGRNEQAMVHVASGYARQRNRLGALVCTTSVGPGATNMVTGAALATVNRLPVLLLPGDTFGSRRPHPVLQQLEVPHDATVSVNDCFRPVSRYFDRIERPEQVIPSALEAMRVLTDQAETGAVTLAMPEDVQTEALEVPEEFLEPRVWTIWRQPPVTGALARATELIRAARRPMIVAGGGLIYSEAGAVLRDLVDATGIPVAETQAGLGALDSGHPLALGAIGATGTAAANRVAREADLVMGVGTRWSDFTTASQSAFQNPEVRFLNLNVAAFDAAKQSGLALVCDAREGLAALSRTLAGHRVAKEWEARARQEVGAWAEEVERLVHAGREPLPSQAEVIGAVNEAAGRSGVVVCAAGSLPGDLHKLWRSRDPKSYQVEYGYSCMGYEIPGGIGAKLAAPEREVFVMVGDGSYLMLPGELATAVAEGIGIVVVLVDNHGYSSIGALSRSLGSAGFGTHYRRREERQLLDAPDGDRPAQPAEPLPVDLAANAESLGAAVFRANTVDDLRAALEQARRAPGPAVVHIEVDRYAGVPSYESWWDVPVAEVSEDPSVQAARVEYEEARRTQRRHVKAP
jgi:3D-(3,5/4)-trihydroxycyclohexane-1,2-dione acylhydrolase (decyclizing)